MNDPTSSTVAGLVLVTGSNGFLGRFVVRELLRGQTCRVLCPVRAPSDAEAAERLGKALEGIGEEGAAAMESGRLLARRGDPSQEGFGMGEEGRGMLGEVGLVINAAASTDQTATVEQLIEANGGRETIRFCVERRLRLSHVSTLAVLGTAAWSPEETPVESLVSALQEAPGYAQAKWLGGGPTARLAAPP